MKHLTKIVILFAGILLFATGCVTTPEATSNSPVDLSLSDTSYERGKYYLSKGYNGLALNHFKTALNSNPGDIPIMNAVAITYQRLDRPDMALTVLEDALRMNSRSSQTLNNIGYFYLSSGHPETALPYFNAIGKEEKYSGTALSNIRLAEQQIAENGLRIQASLKAKTEEPVIETILEHVSLERMSETVYMLNSRFNSTYERAIIHLKLDPRLIVRSAYD